MGSLGHRAAQKSARRGPAGASPLIFKAFFYAGAGRGIPGRRASEPGALVSLRRSNWRAFRVSWPAHRAAAGAIPGGRGTSAALQLDARTARPGQRVALQLAAGCGSLAASRAAVVGIGGGVKELGGTLGSAWGGRGRRRERHGT